MSLYVISVQLKTLTQVCLCVFPSSEGDGVADVCDNILLLSDMAVQPVHPTCAGPHHIHPGLYRLFNNYTGMEEEGSIGLIPSI